MFHSSKIIIIIIIAAKMIIITFVIAQFYTYLSSERLHGSAITAQYCAANIHTILLAFVLDLSHLNSSICDVLMKS